MEIKTRFNIGDRVQFHLKNLANGVYGVKGLCYSVAPFDDVVSGRITGIIISKDNKRYYAIDYDYVFSKYFLYEKRLGKTYYLYRDFTFHFMAIQFLEGNS